MTPYFSIILPIYNVAPYLERCVQSVLMQSFRDYELILVDDGSTDPSSEMCDRFAAQNDCIHVIHKENGGLASARNAGMKIARGKYIWWVDSDDGIEPDALELLYQNSCERLPDVVKFCYFRDLNGRQVVQSNAVPGFYSGDSAREILRSQAFFTTGRFVLSAWSHIYRRDFLEKNRLNFVSERIVGSEDYLFNLEVLSLAETIQVLPFALYTYVFRAGSLTQRYKADLPERYTQLYLELKAFYADAGFNMTNSRRIDSFYVWHLIHSTCIPHAYTVCAGHSMEDGRREVCRILRKKEVQAALKHCDMEGFSFKQRIQMCAMKLRFEPLFYWLYVVKPGKG